MLISEGRCSGQGELRCKCPEVGTHLRSRKRGREVREEGRGGREQGGWGRPGGR